MQVCTEEMIYWYQFVPHQLKTRKMKESVSVTCRMSTTLLWVTLLIVTTLLVIVESCSDVSGIAKDGNTCAELVSADNSECYDSTIETQCCASCAAVATNVAGCNYGDSGTCFTFLCPGLLDPSVCCATCNVVVTTSTTPTTSSTAPSTTSLSTSSTLSTTSSTPSTSSSTVLATSSTMSITSSTASQSPVASTISLVTEQSKTESDNRINVQLIAGSVFGGVAAAVAIIVIVIICAKLYKRSKRQVDPSIDDDIPLKVDKPSDPEHPGLYSTPTMVVIDTEEGQTDKHETERAKSTANKGTENDNTLTNTQENGKRKTISTAFHSDKGRGDVSKDFIESRGIPPPINNTKGVEGDCRAHSEDNVADNGDSVNRTSAKTDTGEVTNLHVEDLDYASSGRGDGNDIDKFRRPSVNFIRDENLVSKIQEEAKFTYPED